MVWWVVGVSGVVTFSVSVPDLMMLMIAIVILWIVVNIVIPGFGLKPRMPFEGSGGLPAF